MKRECLFVLAVIGLMVAACTTYPPPVSDYEAAIGLKVVVAIPRDLPKGTQVSGSPIWKEAFLSVDSLDRCQRATRLRMPDGNDWVNGPGFVCYPQEKMEQQIFRDLDSAAKIEEEKQSRAAGKTNPKKAGWRFRTSCSTEPACVRRDAVASSH